MATAAESGVTKNRIISELTKSPHGKLSEYLPVGQAAAKQEPEFLAHLIAWNQTKGTVRDAKAALPVVSLSVREFPPEFEENSLAHLALLNPREYHKAYRFALEVRLPGRMVRLKRTTRSYLARIERKTERDWDRLMVQHRDPLKSLYALTHTKPGARTAAVLFGGERLPGSMAEAVLRLKDMAPAEVAGTILQRRIPFLVARGALGAKAKEPDVAMALIAAMTPTELATNSKALERIGVSTVPALKAAYDQALERAAKSKKSVLKTTKAAEAVSDEKLKARLADTQEKQIRAVSVEGDWLVLVDKSGSMAQAIDTGIFVGSALAKLAKGSVMLVLFDTMPRGVDATGRTYEQLKGELRGVTANGGTSIGCGVRYAIEKGFNADGIAVVSDGGENNAPRFHDEYERFCGILGKRPPVYLYRCSGDPNALAHNMAGAGQDLQEFDLTGGTDFYAVENLVRTMRTQRYGLVDEIYATPLLRLDFGEEATHVGD